MLHFYSPLDSYHLYVAVFTVAFVCFVYRNCTRPIQRCSLDVWNFTGLWPGHGAHLLGVCPVSLHLQSLWRVLPHHLHDCNTHTHTHTHTHTPSRQRQVNQQNLLGGRNTQHLLLYTLFGNPTHICLLPPNTAAVALWVFQWIHIKDRDMYS